MQAYRFSTYLQVHCSYPIHSDTLVSWRSPLVGYEGNWGSQRLNLSFRYHEIMKRTNSNHKFIQYCYIRTLSHFQLLFNRCVWLCSYSLKQLLHITLPSPNLGSRCLFGGWQFPGTKENQLFSRKRCTCMLSGCTNYVLITMHQLMCLIIPENKHADTGAQVASSYLSGNGDLLCPIS